jgi:hypothetical protein
MRRRVAIAAIALATLWFASPADAQRTRLDDRLSATQTYAVDLGWKPSEIAQIVRGMARGDNSSSPALSGIVPAVDVRLDTRAYAGRTVQIYLGLPPLVAGIDSPADLMLRWQASGEFLSGAVRPGQSVMIFEGVLQQQVTTFLMDFELLLENSPVNDVFSVEPFYEIEVLR